MSSRSLPGPGSLIAAGAVLVVPFFALDGWAADLYWNVVVAAILAVGALAAWRLPDARGAWLWILGGQAGFLLGDVVWMVAERAAGAEDVAILGDVSYFAGYGALAIGLILLSLRQRNRWDPGNLVDAAIVSIGAGVLLWVAVIAPAANDGSSTLTDRIIGVAYPVADLVLIVIVARLATMVGRSRPAWLLLGSLGLLLVADIWYAAVDAGTGYSLGDPVDAVWWMSYVLVVTSVLDPQLHELTRPPAEIGTGRLSAMRIALLAAIALGAPALIAVRAVRGLDLQLPVLLGGTMLLFGLVVARLVIVARELEVHQRRLRHEVTHDALTGLGSRLLFAEQLERALVETGPIRPTVLCLDLDDFKTVNDGLGHAAGDRLLQVIGARLLESVPRPDDVARLGGDEFAVLLEHTPLDQALELADRLLEAISRPVELDEETVVQADASIGIAVAGPASSVDSLLRNADIAMYAAKGRGKGRWEVYRSGMHQLVVERLELRRDLEQAIARREFVLHYQPIFDVATGRCQGYEALVRWEHPTRGLLAPNRFIALAEESGLIVPLGRWILAEACSAVATFPAVDRIAPFVSVNVSAVQLRSSDIVADVEQALADSGLDADRLVLELTESTIIQDTESAATDLGRLRSQGVRVAIDDFGSGFTSLRQLRRLPVDILKIDSELLGPSPTDAVYASIVSMAASLGLCTVGEGVESDERYEQLRTSGCELAQGFWLGGPMPLDEIRARVGSMQRVRISIAGS